MPKKAKKLDPEQLKRQLEDWLEGDEYGAIRDFRNMKDEKFPQIDEITEDVVEDWEELLESIVKMMEEMKVNRKCKEMVNKEYFRSLFFAKTEHEINKQNFTIEKKFVDESFHAKAAFFKIYREVDNVERWEPEEFPARKKAFLKSLQEFDKTFQKHIKACHNEIDTVLRKVIAPLAYLVGSTSNFKKIEVLRDSGKEVPPFRMKALRDKFCQECQDLFKLLYYCEIISDNPSIESVLQKFTIDGWRDSVALAFFITPLEEAYEHMRSFMLEFVDGTNDRVRWDKIRQPIEKNTELMDEIKKLVHREQMCNHLLGDELKREQLEFLYKVHKTIYNSPLKERLIDVTKDTEVRESTITKLATFRALQQMVQWRRDKVLKEEKKELFAREGILDEEDMPKKEVEGEGGEDAVNASRLNESQFKDDKEEEQGDEIINGHRYFLWQRFVSNNDSDRWERAAFKLQHINPQVQEDIDDYIIVTDMKPTTGPGKDNQKIMERAKEIEKLLAEEKKKPLNENEKLRPPYIWNYETPSASKDHTIRLRAEPNEAYIDGRTISLLEDIQDLSISLRTYNKGAWELLSEELISLFRTHDMQQHEEAV